MASRRFPSDDDGRVIVDPHVLPARHAERIRQFRALRPGATEAFRLRFVVELFYRHRELLDAGRDDEAAAMLHELASVASEREHTRPSECVQMQKVWWARALCDAQARAELLQRPVAVVGYAERGLALRRAVPDLPEIDDALCGLLERSHAALLRVKSGLRAADRLGDLRRIASAREGDIEARQACFARGLARMHAHARTIADHARANAVLDELRRIGERLPTGTPRTVALTAAILDAYRHAPHRRLLAELRSIAEHPCARQESRTHYADALAHRHAPTHPLARGYRSDPSSS